MKLGDRVGINAELIVVNRDQTGKRCVCQCAACGRTAVFGVEAVTTGAARCCCTPLSPAERVALRLNERGAETHRQQRDWRPGR